MEQDAPWQSISLFCQLLAKFVNIPHSSAFFSALVSVSGAADLAVGVFFSIAFFGVGFFWAGLCVAPAG